MTILSGWSLISLKVKLKLFAHINSCPVEPFHIPIKHTIIPRSKKKNLKQIFFIQKKTYRFRRHLVKKIIQLSENQINSTSKPPLQKKTVYAKKKSQSFRFADARGERTPRRRISVGSVLGVGASAVRALLCDVRRDGTRCPRTWGMRDAVRAKNGLVSFAPAQTGNRLGVNVTPSNKNTQKIYVSRYTYLSSGIYCKLDVAFRVVVCLCMCVSLSRKLLTTFLDIYSIAHSRWLRSYVCNMHSLNLISASGQKLGRFRVWFCTPWRRNRPSGTPLGWRELEPVWKFMHLFLRERTSSGKLFRSMEC